MARQRLDESRVAVEAETVRYFRSVDDQDDAVRVLASDFTGYGYLFDDAATSVKGLRAELKALQPFLQRTRNAEKQWTDERARRFLQIEQERRFPLGPSEGREFLELRRMQETLRQIEERFPRVAQLETRAREERQKLVKGVAAAATEFPILWRIYATPYPDDSVHLGKIILTELRTTWQSNRTLCDDLADDPELIWKLPPLVRSVLTDAGVDLYSITWTTSEERIAEETDLRTAAIVSMISGLASLGVAGIAALAGAGTILPPIGIALFIVEAVFALVDAIQEYQNYRLHSTAFRACLDPEQALAVEPSLLSAVFTIGIDLLSLIPPARAGRVVP